MNDDVNGAAVPLEDDEENFEVLVKGLEITE